MSALFRHGARPVAGGVVFRVWAPQHHAVNVVLEAQGTPPRVLALTRTPDGFWSRTVPGIGPGQLYRFRIGDGPSFPDPASRFQPQGVHGPSQVCDLESFTWTDQGWPGPDRDNLIIYELHVGAFTPEGTYASASRNLSHLRDLGVTAVQLMPLADFPGRRGWGYDGVAHYAPARCYGTPEDLQRFVDAAHGHGLGVLLDVVYNHFGPDGNYTSVYSPFFTSKKRQTPWGDSLNFDGPHSGPVREFFIENALHWLADYHLDGLRLDATHAIHDAGPLHFLAELARRARAVVPHRPTVLIAEDHRNLASMLRPHEEDGWGFDGVWADDFHHEMRRLLTGDHESFYRDHRGTTEDTATILNRGWLYSGQRSVHSGGPRGSDPVGLDPGRFVICLQNHDQVGNRAFGERLHHQIDAATYRAATAVLLCAPQTPMLFMGQEWATTSPFLYFTDHKPQLGRMVTEGRRREFGQFSDFADPKKRELIPDPQAESTFTRSRLVWEERDRDPHCGVLALYRELLHLRRSEPALRHATRSRFQATAADADTLVLRHDAQDGSTITVVARLRGGGTFRGAVRGRVVLHTEETRFTTDGRPPRVSHSDGVEIEFSRPGAVVLRGGSP